MTANRRLSLLATAAALIAAGLAPQPAQATPGGHGNPNQAAIDRLLAGRQTIIDNCAAAVFKHELLLEAYRDELSDVEDALQFPQPGDPPASVLRARKAVLQGLILGHSSAIINLIKGRDAALRGIDEAIRRLGANPPPA